MHRFRDGLCAPREALTNHNAVRRRERDAQPPHPSRQEATRIGGVPKVHADIKQSEEKLEA
jgi:hypothetical protein